MKSSTKFIALSKLDGSEESVSQLEVLRAIENNFKDSAAAMDFLLNNGEISTPFTIYKVAPPTLKE